MLVLREILKRQAAKTRANLMEGLLEQMNRCREVLSEYQKIPEGAFGAMMIKQDIANAEAAIGSGDVLQMLKAYEALKGVE